LSTSQIQGQPGCDGDRAPTNRHPATRRRRARRRRRSRGGRERVLRRDRCAPADGSVHACPRPGSAEGCRRRLTATASSTKRDGARQRAQSTARKGDRMSMQQIATSPDPYAPYLLSQGIRIGDLLLVSGQVGIDGEGELVSVDDFEVQADQAFRNLATVLEAGGSSLDPVAKGTVFLTHMAAEFPKGCRPPP